MASLLETVLQEEFRVRSVNSAAAALDLVNEQSRRLARLIEHLLDVSSINSGKMVLAFQRVDLRLVIAEVVESCQLTTSRYSIALDGPQALEVTVDPIRIEQVVTNLLDNAIKYSPDGGAIAVELWSPDPAWAAFSVRDHGLGIPADRRERLFERFYRAHTDGTVSGLGLGLFISQHIVDLHAGRITIESPDDGGAKFTVQLPIVRAHDLH